MNKDLETLKLRVLLCYLNSDDSECTVTGIARILNEEKYKISRTMAMLEKDGYMNRENKRHPFLTEKGYRQAEKYKERMETAQKHLLSEGIDMESARYDAYCWALYCSEKTMDIIRDMNEKNRIKQDMAGKKSFYGNVLCKKLKDGNYTFPFTLHKEEPHEERYFKVLSEGFEQPCVLNVKNGIGLLQLKTSNIIVESQHVHQILRGKIVKLQYYSMGTYIGAEILGDIICIPAEHIQFYAVGTGSNMILQGSICLKMQCACECTYMPEVNAHLTIII